MRRARSRAADARAVQRLGLADFSPSVLHWRVRTETRFVEVQQFALMLVVETGPRADHFAGVLERLLISS